jgi:ribose 5-phosphate isomerase B
MRLALGADHAGWRLKDHLRDLLASRGHEVVDHGTHSDESCDYPEIAARVARSVAAGEAELGLLVCGTGIGMAMAANRIPGIRAANCTDLFSVRLAREHNGANVLALGARIVAAPHAEALVDAFLATPFAGGRHQRRIDLIAALDRARDGGA